MANALKNITVPLQSTLNMNRNKSLTCSSYDILNEINAPVFGGSISPLHYKIDYQGDAKYSVDGERWTMDSNKLYRGGLLFKDFTGEYTFDMHDTGLDLDGLVTNGNEFVGVKVEKEKISWYKVDSDFRITASGVIKYFSSDHTLGGFKLTNRGSRTFLFTSAIAPIQNENNIYVQVFVWNGNGFTETANIWTAFRKSTANSTTEKSRFDCSTQTVSNFFTVSKEMSGLLCIGLFKERPKGTNTFKNVIWNTFVVNADGSNIREVSLRAGRKKQPLIGIDTTSTEARGEAGRNLFAFPVDNTNILLGLGSSQDNNTYGWVRVMSIGDSLTQDGTVDGKPAFFHTNSGTFYDAITKYADQYRFSTVKSVGSSCLTANFNGYGRLVIAGFGDSWDDGKGIAPNVNVMYDAQNCSSSGGVYKARGVCNAGVTSNASLPTTEDGWTSWWSSRTISDNTCWNPAGMRAQIGSTNFYTLFNGKEGNAAGISYAVNSSHVGTLLTEWGSIVQTFENCATADKVIFKDAKTNTVKYIQRRSNITLDDVEIVGKYILVRCTADENIYDISSGKWAKFSNDWNNRNYCGYNDFDLLSTSDSYVYKRTWAYQAYASSWTTSGSVAAGYDVAFQKEKGFAPSRLYNYTALSGIVLGEVNAFGYELTSENGLDVFASSGTSAPAYKTTLFGNGASSSVSNLAGGVYPITSSGSAYFNIPIIESTVVDSYNGKYGLKIDGSVYTIAYDGIRPIALYNTSSIVDQVDDFFIVQSQYYALINGYICSLSYSSSNVISGVEQIVNVQGMKFIGAFPSCAYFYSPSARAIFAFTGDADLQLFVQTDRITEVYNSKYYSNGEWIFMSTDDGVYVLTQNNTFRIDSLSVKRFFPTDDDYMVMVLDNETNDNIFLSLTKKSGWETMPVVLETSFFGVGDMKKSTIDEWYIRLFRGDENFNGKVKCTGKTLTDIVKNNTVVQEETITKDKFDANDNFFITYRPEKNFALGQSMKIVSDYPIAYLGFRIGEDGSTNKSKFNI